MEIPMYIAGGAAIFLAVIGIYIYLERPFGLASEAWIDKRLAQLMAQMEHWEQEKNDMVAERKAKAAKIPVGASSAKTKAISDIDAIKAAAYLLENKLIDQPQFEKMKRDILS
jgi:type II secretory pathway component PulM